MSETVVKYIEKELSKPQICKFGFTIIFGKVGTKPLGGLTI